jgi:hypothetical protein
MTATIIHDQMPPGFVMSGGGLAGVARPSPVATAVVGAGLFLLLERFDFKTNPGASKQSQGCLPKDFNLGGLAAGHFRARDA